MMITANRPTSPRAVSCAICASGITCGGNAVLVMMVRSPCRSIVKRPPPRGIGPITTGASGAAGAPGTWGARAGAISLLFCIDHIGSPSDRGWRIAPCLPYGRGPRLVSRAIRRGEQPVAAGSSGEYILSMMPPPRE